VTLTWNKSQDELYEEWRKSDPISYSQHSSIVMSEFAPTHAMAFDLAIGQCKAFDYKAGAFWEALLHRADWRDQHNGNIDASEYYRTGKLPLAQTKYYMNKPDDVLPKGDFGVENEYMHKYTIVPAQKNEIHNREQKEANLQWDMPKPKKDSELA